MEIAIANQQVAGGVQVRVQVRLSGREASRLFVAGDTLIRLPLEGCASCASDSPGPRAAMFLSELAGRREGFSRVFADDRSADSFAAAVRGQIETALEPS